MACHELMDCFSAGRVTAIEPYAGVLSRVLASKRDDDVGQASSVFALVRSDAFNIVTKGSSVSFAAEI